MNKDIIFNLLHEGYYLYGGFVRDYLIRGETFSDIDYYKDSFNGKILNVITKYGLFQAGQEDQSICRVNYHFKLRSFSNDLSCNFFGFNKDGFFALPTEHDFCYNKAFEMILNKEYYYLGGEVNQNKLMSRGWKKVGEENNKREDITAPSEGIWNEYTAIAFDKIRELDKFIGL